MMRKPATAAKTADRLTFIQSSKETGLFVDAPRPVSGTMKLERASQGLLRAPIYEISPIILFGPVTARSRFSLELPGRVNSTQWVPLTNQNAFYR
jgi:hypothetical protein